MGPLGGVKLWYNWLMEEYDKEYHNRNKVQRVSAHSYVVYLILLIVGVVLDLIFKLEIFSFSLASILGFVLLGLATVLIFWSQYTSHHLKDQNISKEVFAKGPYKFTRSPTQWGVFFMMMGLGIILQAAFVVLFTLIAFLVNRFTFLGKRERVMEERYGEHYREYKKSVHF